MNDEELDKRFGLEEADEEGVIEAEEKAAPEAAPEKEKAPDKEQIKAEEKRLARQRRAKAAEEYARKIELAREEARKKRAEKARLRKLRKETGLPLGQRLYLKDFPLKFLTILWIYLGISVLLFIWAFMSLPSMRVDNIFIEGNHALPDEYIIEYMGISEGEHIFSRHSSSARRLVSENPYIMSASVVPVFPSGIRVTLDERTKIAYIKTPDGYIAIDDEGTVLEFSAEYTADVHPVISGLNIDHAVLGKKLDILEDMDYQKMIIVLGAVLAADENSTKDDDYSLFENLKEVRIVPSGLIFITVTLPEGSDLQVKLDDIDNISDDMHWLMYAIEEGAMYNLPHGALDMTGDEYIFRESVS